MKTGQGLVVLDEGRNRELFFLRGGLIVKVVNCQEDSYIISSTDRVICGRSLSLKTE